MVKILGHRGARNLWTENTLGGFAKAAALGVDMIEFDVHLSADGVGFVMHDALLERTSQASGPLAALSSAPLQTVRLKDSDETIPTLDQVLDLLAATPVELAIEIKTTVDGSPYPDIEKLILDQLARRNLAQRSLILSFVPDCLERVRTLNSDVGLQACLWRPQADMQGGLEQAMDRLERIGGVVVALQEDLFSCNEDLCFARVPEERLAVCINNDPQRLEYWLHQPVRHLSTDRPDIALALRDEGRISTEYY